MSDIVIDFGGTTIKIGLIQDGRVIAKTHVPALSGIGIKPRLFAQDPEVSVLLGVAHLLHFTQT